MTAPVTWTFARFDALSVHDVYGLLALRQAVFIVEQHCPYQDADGADRDAWHLLGKNESGEITACLRILPPGARYPEPAIGRVVTAPTVRRTGLGRQLMQEGLRRTGELFPGQSVRLSAQSYLKDFYGSLGFVPIGEPYEEDGIPHIGMVHLR